MTELPPTPECESCACRDVVIAAQTKAIQALTAANARLVERVTALERIVGRNSGNSSMPPLSDDLPGRSKPQPKPVKASGRKRGKQPGAAGSSLPWVAVPDEHVAHRPRGDCGCGADLVEATEEGIERSYQTHDLPEIHITVRQHDVYRVRCACGREHVAALPDGVSLAPSSYGGCSCGAAHQTQVPRHRQITTSTTNRIYQQMIGCPHFGEEWLR